MERKKPGNVDFAGPLWEVLERWRAAHEAVGANTQSLLEAWVKARSADLAQGMRFYTDMAGCRDPAMMLSLQQRWLLDSANRLQAEFQDLGEKVMKLANGGLAAKRDSDD